MRLFEILKPLIRSARHDVDLEVVIPIADYGGRRHTPAVPLVPADCGIDWDKGRILLRPRQLLSRLSREDVQEAIHDSLRGRQSLGMATRPHNAMVADVRAVQYVPAQEKAHTAAHNLRLIALIHGDGPWSPHKKLTGGEHSFAGSGLQDAVILNRSGIDPDVQSHRI